MSKKSNINILLRKVISFVTCFAFVFTMVLTDAWANIPNQVTRAGALDLSSSPSEVNIDTLRIPTRLGQIKDFHNALGGKTVIHLQDAHCNYFAQERIADLIAYLNKKFSIDVVNLEGGVGEYDLGVFTSISGKEIRREVAKHFVKTGEISGAEFFAINNPEKIKLWGVENRELYLSNLRVYRDYLSYKNEVDKFLFDLNHLLNDLKRHIFSEKLLSLDMAFGAYKAGNLEFREYLDIVFAEAAQNGIDTAGFKNISLLKDVLSLEGKIDFDKANIERNLLVEKLKEALTRNEVKALVKKTIDFKTQKISRKEFYEYVIDSANEIGVKKTEVPQLVRYLEYISIYEKIDTSKVMDELEALEIKLKDVLCKSEDQKRLVRLSRDLALTKNIFGISLTKRDYEYFLANRDDFYISNYTDFINEKASGLGVENDLSGKINRLDNYLDQISKFYDYSFKRDKALIKNMKFTSKDKNTSVAILVTGGFHTDNLCQLFKEKNISYVSILPKFDADENYKCPYFDLLAGGSGQIDHKLNMVLARSSMLAIASKFSSLGLDVWGRDSVYLMRAKILIQSYVEQGKCVSLTTGIEKIDSKEAPAVFGRGKNSETLNITAIELLSSSEVGCPIDVEAIYSKKEIEPSSDKSARKKKGRKIFSHINSSVALFVTTLLGGIAFVAAIARASTGEGVEKISEVVIKNGVPSFVPGAWGSLIVGLIIGALIAFAIISKVVRKKTSKDAESKILPDEENDLVWLIRHFDVLIKDYIDTATLLERGMPSNPLEHTELLQGKYLKIVKLIASYVDMLNETSPVRKALVAYRKRLGSMHEDVSNVYTVYYDRVWAQDRELILEGEGPVSRKFYENNHSKAETIWDKWSTEEGKRKEDLLELIRMKSGLKIKTEEAEDMALNERALDMITTIQQSIFDRRQMLLGQQKELQQRKRARQQEASGIEKMKEKMASLKDAEQIVGEAKKLFDSILAGSPGIDLNEEEIQDKLSSLEKDIGALEFEDAIYSEVFHYLKELISLSWKEADERTQEASKKLASRVRGITSNLRDAFSNAIVSEAFKAAPKEKEKIVKKALANWSILNGITEKWLQIGVNDIYEQMKRTGNTYLPKAEFRIDNGKERFYGTWTDHELSFLLLEDEDSREMIEKVISGDCHKLRDDIIAGKTYFSEKDFTQKEKQDKRTINRKRFIAAFSVFVLMAAIGLICIFGKPILNKYLHISAPSSITHTTTETRGPPRSTDRLSASDAHSEGLSGLSEAVTDMLNETDVNIYDDIDQETRELILKVEQRKAFLLKKQAVLTDKIKKKKENIQRNTNPPELVAQKQGLVGMANQREQVTTEGAMQDFAVPPMPKSWTSVGQAMEMEEPEMPEEAKDLGEIGEGLPEVPEYDQSSDMQVGSGNDSIGSWVATSLDNEGNPLSFYLIEKGFPVVNPATGQGSLLPPDWQRIALDRSANSDQWVVLDTRGRKDIIALVPPGKVIADVQKSRDSDTSKVGVYYDSANGAWALRFDKSPGMIRIIVRDALPGELKNTSLFMLDETDDPDWIGKIPLPVRDMIAKAKGKSTQERMDVLKRIMSLFYYSTNPELKDLIEKDPHFIEFSFKYLAHSCDGVAKLGAIIANELNLPFMVTGGYFDVHKKDGVFDSETGHSFGIMPDNTVIDIASDFCGEVSPLWGRRAKALDYAAEMEYIRQRAKRTLSMLSQSMELDTLEEEQAQIQNQIQGLKERIRNIIGSEDQYIRLKNHYNAKLQALNIPEMAKNPQKNEPFARALIDACNGFVISNKTVKTPFELMAKGHFLLGMMQQIEKGFPNLSREAQEAKNSTFKRIKHFAQDPGVKWKLHEILEGAPAGVSYRTRWLSDLPESLTIVPVMEEGVLTKKIVVDIYTGATFTLSPDMEVVDYRGGILWVKGQKPVGYMITQRYEMLLGEKVAKYYLDNPYLLSKQQQEYIANVDLDRRSKKGPQAENLYTTLHEVSSATSFEEAFSFQEYSEVEELFVAPNGKWLAVVKTGELYNFIGSATEGAPRLSLPYKVLDVKWRADGSWVATCAHGVSESPRDEFYYGVFNGEGFKVTGYSKVMPAMFIKDDWVGAGRKNNVLYYDVLLGPGAQKVKEMVGDRPIVECRALPGGKYLILAKNTGQNSGYSLIGPWLSDNQNRFTGQIYLGTTMLKDIVGVYPEGLIIQKGRMLVSSQGLIDIYSLSGPLAEAEGVDGAGFKGCGTPRFFSDGSWVLPVRDFDDGKWQFVGTAVDDQLKDQRFEEIFTYVFTDDSIGSLNYEGLLDGRDRSGIFVLKSVCEGPAGAVTTAEEWLVVAKPENIIGYDGDNDTLVTPKWIVTGSPFIRKRFKDKEFSRPVMINEDGFLTEYDSAEKVVKAPGDISSFVILVPSSERKMNIVDSVGHWRVAEQGVPRDTMVSIMTLSDGRVSFVQDGISPERSGLFSKEKLKTDTGTNLTMSVMNRNGSVRNIATSGQWSANWFSYVIDRYDISAPEAEENLPCNINIKLRYINRIAAENKIEAMNLLIEVMNSIGIDLRSAHFGPDVYTFNNPGSGYDVDPQLLAQIIINHRDICRDVFWGPHLGTIMSIFRGTQYEYLIMDLVVDLLTKDGPITSIEDYDKTRKDALIESVLEHFFKTKGVNFRHIVYSYINHCKQEAGLSNMQIAYIFPHLFLEEDEGKVRKLNELLFDVFEKNGKENPKVLALAKNMRELDEVLSVLQGVYNVGSQRECSLDLELNNTILALISHTLSSFADLGSVTFDVQYTPEVRSSPLWKITRLLMSSPERLRFKYDVLGGMLADMDQEIDSVQTENETRSRFRQINQKLTEILGEDVGNLDESASWEDFWDEFSHNSAAMLFLIGLIAVLLTYGADGMRRRDLILGSSGSKTLQEIWDNTPWFTGRRREMAEEILAEIQKLRDKPMTYKQLAKFEVLRSSLPDNQKALFDLVSCIAFEAPLAKKGIGARLINLLPFAAVGNVFDTVEHRKRQAMNRELVAITGSIDETTLPEDIRASLFKVLEKYISDLPSEEETLEAAKKKGFGVFKKDFLKILNSRTLLEVDEKGSYQFKIDGSSIRKPGSSQNFLWLREMHPDDPAERIDWKASLKTGWPYKSAGRGLMVREYEKEVTREADILVDLRSLGDPSQRITCAEDLAKSIKVMFDANGVRDRKKFVLNAILFIMPDGRVLKEENTSGRRFDYTKGRSKELLENIKKKYEEAGKVSVSTSFDFYTDQQNERMAQRAGSVIRGRSQTEAFKELREEIAGIKPGKRDVFCAGIQQADRDEIIAMLSKKRIRPFFWTGRFARIPVVRSKGTTYHKLARKYSGRVAAVIKKAAEKPATGGTAVTSWLKRWMERKYPAMDRNKRKRITALFVAPPVEEFLFRWIPFAILQLASVSDIGISMLTMIASSLIFIFMHEYDPRWGAPTLKKRFRQYFVPVAVSVLNIFAAGFVSQLSFSGLIYPGLCILVHFGVNLFVLSVPALKLQPAVIHKGDAKKLVKVTSVKDILASEGDVWEGLENRLPKGLKYILENTSANKMTRPDKSLLAHTAEVFKALDLEEADKVEMESFSPRALVRIAAVFHDAGKFMTEWITDHTQEEVEKMLLLLKEDLPENVLGSFDAEAFFMMIADPAARDYRYHETISQAMMKLYMPLLGFSGDEIKIAHTILKLDRMGDLNQEMWNWTNDQIDKELSLPPYLSSVFPNKTYRQLQRDILRLSEVLYTADVYTLPFLRDKLLVEQGSRWKLAPGRIEAWDRYKEYLEEKLLLEKAPLEEERYYSFDLSNINEVIEKKINPDDEIFMLPYMITEAKIMSKDELLKYLHDVREVAGPKVFLKLIRKSGGKRQCVILLSEAKDGKPLQSDQPTIKASHFTRIAEALEIIEHGLYQLPERFTFSRSDTTKSMPGKGVEIVFNLDPSEMLEQEELGWLAFGFDRAELGAKLPGELAAKLIQRKHHSGIGNYLVESSQAGFLVHQPASTVDIKETLRLNRIRMLRGLVSQEDFDRLEKALLALQYKKELDELAKEAKDIFSKFNKEFINTVESLGYSFADVAGTFLKKMIFAGGNFQTAAVRLKREFPHTAKTLIGYDEGLIRLRNEIFGEDPTDESIELADVLGRFMAIKEILDRQLNDPDSLKRIIPENLTSSKVSGKKTYYDLASGTVSAGYFKGLDPERKYVFVDVSPFAIGYLQQAKKMLGADNEIEVVKKDLLTLDLTKNSVDTVRMSNVANYVSPENIPDSWYEQLLEAITDGGEIIIEFRPNDAQYELNEPIISKLLQMTESSDDEWTATYGQFENGKFTPNEPGSELAGVHSYNDAGPFKNMVVFAKVKKPSGKKLKSERDNIDSCDIFVHQRDAAILQSEGVIATDSLNSCIAVILHDPKNKVGALAHFDVNTLVKDSFDALIAELENNGADISDLNVSLIGGRDELSEELIASLYKTIKDMNITINETDLLGTRTRTAAIDVASGKLYNYTGKALEDRLLWVQRNALFETEGPILITTIPDFLDVDIMDLPVARSMASDILNTLKEAGIKIRKPAEVVNLLREDPNISVIKLKALPLSNNLERVLGDKLISVPLFEESKKTDKIIPGITAHGRNAILDRYILDILKRKAKSERTVVDLGVGFPPVTTVELFESIQKKFGTAEVIGVDINIPHYVVEFPKNKYETYIAFFNEYDELVSVFVRQEGRDDYIYLNISESDIEMVKLKAERVKNYLISKAKGEDLELDSQKITFHPMAKLEEVHRGLRFVKGGFELPIDKKAHIIRAMNVFTYYTAEETEAAIKSIGDKLAEGGILIIGEQEGFIVFKKENGEMKEKEIAVRTTFADMTEDEGRALVSISSSGINMFVRILNRQFPRHEKLLRTLQQALFVHVLSRYSKWQEIKEDAKEAGLSIDMFLGQMMARRIKRDIPGTKVDKFGYVHVPLNTMLNFDRIPERDVCVEDSEGGTFVGNSMDKISMQSFTSDQESITTSTAQELDNIRNLKKSDVVAIVVLDDDSRLKDLNGVGNIDMENLRSKAERIVSKSRNSKVLYVKSLEEAQNKAASLADRDWTNTFIFTEETFSASDPDRYQNLKENYFVWNLHVPQRSICGVTPLGFLTMSLKMNDLIIRAQNGSGNMDLESLARIMLYNLRVPATSSNIQVLITDIIQPISEAKTKQELLSLSGKFTLNLPRIEPKNWTEVSELFSALEEVYTAL